MSVDFLARPTCRELFTKELEILSNKRILIQ
jgi:hypothetical protein